MKRTRESLRVLSVLSQWYPDVPALFCGDLFHKAESVDTDLLREWTTFNDVNYNWRMYYINGNHELNHKNDPHNYQLGIPDMLCKSWMRSLNFGWTFLKPNIIVHGIPYIDNNTGVDAYLKSLIEKEKIGSDNTKHILMLHTTYPGARDTDGREIESPNSINPNLLNKFDLVLCGHIHKPQQLSKKVYMIGAPIQQRRTDKDAEMGFWKLYDDLSMKFIPLDGWPKFIDVETEEEVKDDGNYYTVLGKKSSEIINPNHKITKQLSPKSLARKYMRAKGVKNPGIRNKLTQVLNQSQND